MSTTYLIETVLYNKQKSIIQQIEVVKSLKKAKIIVEKSATNQYNNNPFWVIKFTNGVAKERYYYDGQYWATWDASCVWEDHKQERKG